jgi:hypothetical protein
VVAADQERELSGCLQIVEFWVLEHVANNAPAPTIYRTLIANARN